MELVRRLIDFVVSICVLIVLTPLLCVIALAIRLESPGPVIFRQQRVGKNGRLFNLLKFRSMRQDCDAYGFSPDCQDDPRITRVGRFLRRTSLDELPQFVNVMQGQMTLVGPRPLLYWQYCLWDENQRRRCLIRPGLTGWAQINGRGGLTHEDKIELDLWYLDHRSAALDLRIIIKTISRVLHGEDILEVQYSRDKPQNKSVSR